VSASASGVAQIALSNALPVIASSAGGLSEAVIDGVNGLMFSSGDSDALAERIVYYFANNLGPVFSNNLRASVGSRRTAADIIEEVAGSNSIVTETVNLRAAV
jgi:glycosyltransferase involved in cell wall biosynthesis